MPAKTATKPRRQYMPPELRPSKTPPHLSIRTLRAITGLTLEQVAQRINDAMPEVQVSRGTLSAIESGSRGVSDLMLRALEKAYGAENGSFSTSYVPRGTATDEQGAA